MSMKKILADESVDFRIVKALRQSGYQIEAIIELSPGIRDDEVLELANKIDAILLTEDKDFGELTYRLKKSNQGILLFRMSGEVIGTKVDLLKKVLSEYSEKLTGKFTVVTVRKIRVKPLDG